MKEGSLDELQLKIMKALWSNGKSSVQEIREELAKEKPLAINTIGTVLKRLEEKGFVSHFKDSRKFIFSALVSEQKAQSSALSKLKERFFDGRNIEIVNHLIDAKQLTDEEIDLIKTRLEKLNKDS